MYEDSNIKKTTVGSVVTIARRTTCSEYDVLSYHTSHEPCPSLFLSTSATLVNRNMDQSKNDNRKRLQTVCRSSWYSCRCRSKPATDCITSSDLSSPGSSLWQHAASLVTSASCLAAAATFCIDGVSMTTCLTMPGVCGDAVAMQLLCVLSAATRALW